MSDGPKPTYIYKLVPTSAAPPDPLPERLPVSELDQKSKFIHASTAKQVPRTLKHFFANDEKVYILRIKYDVVESVVKWEDPKGEVCGPRAGEGMFPHLHNGLKVGKDEVESVVIWERTEAGWDEALKKAEEEGWLVF